MQPTHRRKQPVSLERRRWLGPFDTAEVAYGGVFIVGSWFGA